MNELHDLLLARPFGQSWIRALLFAGFALHLAFVLLMLGSAVLGLTHLFRAWASGKRQEWELSSQFLKPFFVFKSIAIVLGIAPLLLIQVGYTIPFMTAGNLFAPLWMGIVVLLIAALFLLEYSIHHHGQRTPGVLICALAGGACLLAVAGVLTLVLVTTENPQWWREIALGGQLPPAGSIHWAIRLLHVLGAAVVIAAVFHLATTGAEAHKKRSVLGNWLAGALLFQIVGGIALYASLIRPPGALITALVILAAALAALLLWQARYGSPAGRSSKTSMPMRTEEGSGSQPALLSVVAVPEDGHAPGWSKRGLMVGTILLLVTMLVVRQLLQERVLLPVSAQLAKNAREYHQQLRAVPVETAVSPAGPTGLVVPRSRAAVVFLESCAFCHNGVANGKGPEAARLTVPPEDLNAMRVKPRELRRILLEGIPGTAMPRFGFYTRHELDALTRFLLSETGLRHELEPFTPPIDGPAARNATTLFYSRCVICHGEHGRGTALARTFSPTVPDLTQLSLSPEQISQVVASGYPGTMMPAFENLSPAVRLHLARHIRSFFRPEPDEG